MLKSKGSDSIDPRFNLVATLEVSADDCRGSPETIGPLLKLAAVSGGPRQSFARGFTTQPKYNPNHHTK